MAAVRPWTQEGRGFAHLHLIKFNFLTTKEDKRSPRRCESCFGEGIDFVQGQRKAVLPLKENNQEHDMEIKNLKLAELRLNPTNPREVVEEKYKQLIESILVFPKMLELRPIVHNARREVLGGNMRLRALQDIAQMSLEDIKARLECLEGYRSKPQAERVALLEFWQRWLDSPYAPAASAEGLTDAEQQEFIIKDNLSFGKWDWEALANDWDEEQLGEWGLDVWQPKEEGKDDDEGYEDDEDIDDLDIDEVKFGLPYMGSKSQIALWVVSHLPSAPVLYDLFAGGCAITHCALLSGKWERIVYNDINGVPEVFEKAVKGEYKGLETEWISREDFERLKGTDLRVALQWSFGNNMQAYMYSRKLEPYKYALHQLLVAPTIHDRRLLYRNAMKELEKIAPVAKTTMQSLERLQSDYRDVPIAEGAVVYCDIPYRNTASYVSGDFDHEAFYDWAEKLGQTHQVFISEYDMPRDRFDLVAETKKQALLNAKAREGEGVTERLFTPKKRS